MSKILPVLLAGGRGVRLRPLSSDARPKQFLPLTHAAHSMLALTAMRVVDERLFLPPCVVCLVQHAALAKDDLPHARYLLEPCARNTAPAIILAAIHAQHNGIGSILALPCDHEIADVAAFVRNIEAGYKASDRGRHPVLFGITPNKPHTGYGYLKANTNAQLTSFIEKPDASTAARLIDDGYLWNSGIFLLPVQAFLKHVPPILRQRLEAIYQSGDWIESDFVAPKAAYTQLPNISIDHAFFENAPDARVIKADFAWRDIGTWATLNELQHEQAKAVEYA